MAYGKKTKSSGSLCAIQHKGSKTITAKRAYKGARTKKA